MSRKSSSENPPGTTPLTSSDVEALLKLMLDVWELRGDARHWRKHFLQGLCTLVDAPVGLTANTRNHAPTGRTRLDLLVDVGWSNAAHRLVYLGNMRRAPLGGPVAASVIGKNGHGPGSSKTLLREDLISDEEWYASPVVQKVYKAADVNHGLYWIYFGPEAGMTMSVNLFRTWKEARRFSSREVALLAHAGTHLPRLYVAEMEQHNRAPNLPPRARQTLSLLLAGKNEVQIAELLHLSRHTVHDYIKNIYRKYKVASRSELMAGFIG